MMPGLKVCPQCGKERVSEGREIEQVDGSLQKLSFWEEQQKINTEYLENGARLKHREYPWRKCETLSELREYARLHGYNEKWAYIIWGNRKKKQQALAKEINGVLFDETKVL
jgi:hypothetical protein